MKQFELTQAEYEEDGELVTGRYLLTGRPTTLHEATETFLALEQVKKQTFIAQGFILRVVRDDCLYQQAGYVDINSYAKGELGLGKEGSRVDSIVNRYININKRFSSGGYSAVIDDRYMNYSYSALSEIWTMTDEEIESAGITETTTVAKIREIKRENREDEPEEQIPGQTEITDFLPDVTGSEGSEREKVEEQEEEDTSSDRELDLFREFTYEYYKNYMDRDQHLLLEIGDEKGFTAYTEELNYMLLDNDFDENSCIVKNMEVKFNFAKTIFLRRAGTYDKWVVRKISDLWMSLIVMKVLKKLPDTYRIGELNDRNGHNAYQRMTDRLSKALIDELAQEGTDISRSGTNIRNNEQWFRDRKISFYCGSMEYLAKYDNIGEFFCISRYKRTTQEIEEAEIMEIERYDVEAELLKLTGLQQQEKSTLQQLKEIEEKLMENIMESLECESDKTVDEIMSGEKEFYEYILEDVGDNPDFNSCYQMLIHGKEYFYYVSGYEIQVVEAGRHRGEKNVAKVAIATLYERIKGLLEEDGSVATSQQEEKAENRINTPAEGHFEGENGQNGQHNVENGRKETVEMPENRINTLADVNPEAVEKEEQKTEKEEVLEAEVLKRSPEYLHLQIDLSGYGNEMTKDRRIEDAINRVMEPLKNITQREVRAFNFAIDFIKGVTKARTLLRLYNEEKRQAERQQDELPDMKNNDQRREFIGTYRSWPLWSENKKTKERFYRYEFQNGDAFIIKDVYSNRERYDWNERKNVRKAEWTKQAGFIIKNGAQEELNDCVVSETVMIDYLREMKKKG